MFNKLIASSFKPILSKSTPIMAVPQVRFAPKPQVRNFATENLVLKAIQEDKLPQIPSDWSNDQVKIFLNKFASTYNLSSQQKETLLSTFRTYSGDQFFKFDDEGLVRLLNDEKLAKNLYLAMGGTFSTAQLTSEFLSKTTMYLSPLFLGICFGLYLYFREKSEHHQVLAKEPRSGVETTQSQVEEKSPTTPRKQ